MENCKDERLTSRSSASLTPFEMDALITWLVRWSQLRQHRQMSIIYLMASTMLASHSLMPAPAQQGAAQNVGAPGTRPVESHPQDSVPDDIIVEGYRERKKLDTRTGVPTATNTVDNRVKYEYSERLAKCALRGRLSSIKMLRAVVDGEVNTASYTVAQDRLVRSNITCGESPQLLTFTGPPTTKKDGERALGSQISVPGDTGDFTGISGQTSASPLGFSIYDRGAFTVETLKRYAPDLKLTKAQTNDPAVQSRFNLREVPRNRFRLREDYKYFEVAVCVVRVEPRLAVRLAMSDGGARLGDLQEALIDRARVCVGNSPHVKVDPTQFRLYIADAVYRWAVAARGVDTLLPSQQ